MQLFSWNDIQSYLNTGIQNQFFSKGTGISVGSFDGLHLGHRELLSRLISNCKEKNLIPGVISFKRPLPSIKHTGDYQGDVSTLDQRLNLFEEVGIEFAIIIDFDESFASILGTDFLNILVNAINMDFICEGIDFRFGYKGATDVSAIKYFAQQNNIGTYFVDQVIYKEGTDEEERISSSFIRSMILKGFFTTVSELLNRSYEITFDSVTDEIEKSSLKQVIPANGVYYCINENNESVRVQITDSKIKLNLLSKSIKFI